MRLKPNIFAVASTANLRQIVEDFELSVNDKRELLIDAISSGRRCTPEHFLVYLSEPEIKQVCEVVGFEWKGRKIDLIARLLELRRLRMEQRSRRAARQSLATSHSTNREREQT